ncbi:hypothetical protein [Nocardia sp. NPDC047038]|uniref:hypothetical protein n=1 Tax=Nocardia sp. NPDC047038 TaxID=3154338 RepID=UPI0033CB702C
MADLTWRMRSVERDAAAARMLAGDADRDVAEISAQTQRLPPGHRGELRRDASLAELRTQIATLLTSLTSRDSDR